MNPPEAPAVRAPLAAATEPISATAKLTKFYGKARGYEGSQGARLPLAGA